MTNIENKTSYKQTLKEKVKEFYDSFGQKKQMGQPSLDLNRPHFFLHRPFACDQDLLIIFNTKRCSYKCDFCQLPLKCSRSWISGDHILSQFEYVMSEMKNSLSLLTRITLSNEGSMFDTKTFPTKTLMAIIEIINELKLVRKIVLETRLEYIQFPILNQIKSITEKATIDILTGFETLDNIIRDEILNKSESIEVFLKGLDVLSKVGTELTSYIIFKPSPSMSDEEAYCEAKKSVDFLIDQCNIRKIPLFIRLNPMYVAIGSKWAKLAMKTTGYKPPKLTDVMKIANYIRNRGIGVYIGLSTEGVGDQMGTYMSREDYSFKLIKPIKLFNDNKINSFDGII